MQEEAIDNGGPSREFWRLFTHEVVKQYGVGEPGSTLFNKNIPALQVSLYLCVYMHLYLCVCMCVCVYVSVFVVCVCVCISICGVCVHLYLWYVCVCELPKLHVGSYELV